jgi:hypothetical protein
LRTGQRRICPGTARCRHFDPAVVDAFAAILAERAAAPDGPPEAAAGYFSGA